MTTGANFYRQRGGTGIEPIENREGVQSERVTIAAAGVAYQLPDMTIPDGFAVVVIAWPDNKGIVYVAEGEIPATDPDEVTPLAPGAAVPLFIKNPNVLWVSSTQAGDHVAVTCER